MVILATIPFTEGGTPTQSMVATEMTQFTGVIMLTLYLAAMEMILYLEAVEMEMTHFMAKMEMILYRVGEAMIPSMEGMEEI